MAFVRRNLAGMAGALVSLLFLAGAAAQVGCRDLSEREEPDAGPAGDGGVTYPPPRKNLVAAVGSDATLDVATWNIQLFPKDPATPALAADLITSLALDVVVVEEITDEAAWNELAERLPEHEAVLSPHVYSDNNYQKLGVLFRKGLVTAGTLRILFNGDGGPFPRPLIQVPITVNDGVHAPLTIDLIGVHLKAGVTTSDRNRRVEAMMKIDEALRAQVDGGGEDEVIILGDFNEVVSDAVGQAVFAPLLGAPDRYKVQTAAYAQAGGITYLGFGGRDLDHIVTTAGLAAETTGGELVVPRLDLTFNGYQPLLSDHLPVVLKIPLR
jgi:endonuclease/exonuclease/phosphatase family metal-dependent hydrolase